MYRRDISVRGLRPSFPTTLQAELQRTYGLYGRQDNICNDGHTKIQPRDQQAHHQYFGSMTERAVTALPSGMRRCSP